MDLKDLNRLSGKKKMESRHLFFTCLSILMIGLGACEDESDAVDGFSRLSTRSAVSEVLFFDDFESDLGWMTDPDGSDSATEGAWERANPEPTSRNGITYQLGTTVSGSYDLVTKGAAGDGYGQYDVDGGKTSILSPQIDLPADGTIRISLSYYLAHSSYARSDDYLTIQVVGSSTQTVLDVRGSDQHIAGEWQSLSQDISGFAGQTIEILVEAADFGQSSLIEAAVDDVKIEVDTAPADCDVPTGLNATNISQTGATIGWNAVPNGSSYKARYREIGTTQWIDINFVSGTSTALYSLAEDTAYEFQVATNCPESQSSFSSSATFETLSGSLPYDVFNDDFETDRGWVTDPQNSDTATKGHWERGNPEATTYQLGDAVSGFNCLITTADAGSSVGTYDIDKGYTTIVSPTIQLPSQVSLSLSFSYYMAHDDRSSSDDFLTVELIGASQLTVFDERGTPDEDSPSWQTFNIDISQFAGQDIQLQVRAADAGTGGYVEAAIDDVRIVAGASPFIDYEEYTHVLSGGWGSGRNEVLIKIGDHTFFENVPSGGATAGLYVVAIHENNVLINEFYQTFLASGAARGLRDDIQALPHGAFVVIAAKDEPTCAFDSYGQEALTAIGATTNLVFNPGPNENCSDGPMFRTSYYAMGKKGQGTATERVSPYDGSNNSWIQTSGDKVGQHLDLTFPPPPADPIISTIEGQAHEGYLGQMRFKYYIPNNFNPSTAEFMVGIHGAGQWHWPGAETRVKQFSTMTGVADTHNLVVVAPAFDAEFNWEPQDSDYDWHNHRFVDQTIFKDYYLWDFVYLLSDFSPARSDLALIELMEVFKQQLDMPRSKFYLHGHSGGGQYVNRFSLLYPEKLYAAFSSSPGTVAMPDNTPYPNGLNTDNLKAVFGNHIDATGIEGVNLWNNLQELCDLGYHVLVGSAEQWEEPDGSWTDLPVELQAYYDAMLQAVPGCGINFEILDHCPGGCTHTDMVDEGVYRAVELLF